MNRQRWRVQQAIADLPDPWPQLPELACALPPASWTLVGGLMVQAHLLHAGLNLGRPTIDIDMIIHIETGALTWLRLKRHLNDLGYSLLEPVDHSDPPHRFIRPEPLTTRRDQIVDVLIADHPAPRAVKERVGPRNLIRAPGGTSALRKTVNLQLSTGIDTVVTVSLPNVLGALTLKGGAYRTPTPDRERHLQDAALLCATVEDADALVESKVEWTGSDAHRIRVLSNALPGHHPAWSMVPRRLRLRAQSNLAILAEGPRREK